jgi:hypothetical protein
VGEALLAVRVVVEAEPEVAPALAWVLKAAGNNAKGKAAPPSRTSRETKATAAEKAATRKKGASGAKQKTAAQGPGSLGSLVLAVNSASYEDEDLFDESGEPLYLEDGTFIDDLEPSDVK